MIPEKIKLEIYTPERKVLSEDVSSVRVPGAGGYFGVFPGHTPFIAALQVGEIKVDIDGAETRYTAGGGIAEAMPGSVSIMAETCELAGSIDVKRADEALARAKKRIAEGRKSWDVDRAQLALARALNRLRVGSR